MECTLEDVRCGRLPRAVKGLICSNSRCQKRIEQPILLDNRSAELIEPYYVCPHCFTKLTDGEKDGKSVETPLSNSASHPAIQKVREAISANTTKPTEMKIKDRKISRKTGEKKHVVPPTDKSAPTQKVEGCLHHLGYLGKARKQNPDASIPSECFVCTKIVDCMLRLDDA